MKKWYGQWLDIVASLWFVPGALVLGAIALAVGLVELDGRIDYSLREDWPRLFGSGAEGSRALLAAIAGSMVTVGGTVFSITIVALSLASSQYSSRVLRNFMSDRTNQTVLGTFVGVFVYCLVVLRTVNGGESGFVPSLAVMGAVVLSLLSAGLLVYFFHHIASYIQAAQIIAVVHDDTVATIDAMYPPYDAREDGARDERTAAPPSEARWATVDSHRTGYIQRADPSQLDAVANGAGCLLRLEHRIGDFVVKGTPLASLTVTPPVDRRTAQRVRAAFTISRQRTVDQDVAFGIRQLTDVAVKALSPGINDTTTALMCVDYLTAILIRLAGRRIDNPLGGKRRTRLFNRGPGFDDFLAGAFHPIRQNAEHNPEVLLRLLDAIATVGRFSPVREHYRVLSQEADLVAAAVAHGVTVAAERDRLLERASEVRRQLAQERVESAAG